MTDKNTVYLIAGAAILGAFALSRTSAGNIGKSIGGGAIDMVTGILTGAAEAVPEAINPASDQNIIYSTISRAGQSITGQPGWSLGGAIYDWTH